MIYFLRGIIMTNSEKKWKDFLLSSSIPLEHSVKQILSDLGLKNASEYNYIKPNESGISTNFSIDFRAFEWGTSYKKNTCSNINYLIECKYRHPGVRWIFMPESHYNCELFSLIHYEYQMEYIANMDILVAYFNKYPLVGKGIEILAKDANPKGIDQCVHQLSYAYIDKYIDAIGNEFNFEYYIKSPFCIIPIIVTTSELWRINKNTTIETIQKSEDITDIASKHDCLLYQFRPDNSMQNYFMNRFNNLPEKIKNKLKKIHDFKYSGETFEEGLYSQCIISPDTILIINYDVFKKEFKKLKKFFYEGTFWELWKKSQ